MKKSIKKLVSVVFVSAFFLTGIGIVPGQMKAANVPTNETMETATPIELGGTASCTFNEEGGEAHYFKFTVPQNIGNQWITFTATNYTNGNVDVALLDFQGTVVLGDASYYRNIGKQGTCSIETRTEGADTWLDETRMLIPGNTYYIRVRTAWDRITGNVTASIASVKDDNWGTYDKADSILVGQWKKGKIEKNDDIDCFSVVLPNDSRNHTFNISCDHNVKVSFSNGNRVLLSEVSVDANTTNTTYKVTGKGQKIYIRVQAGNDDVKAANYSIKVSTQKKRISKLKLSKYKRNSKKIVGTTIGNATVKVKINKRTYSTNSSKNGKFTVKLKKKLKSKNKIKVSVSKAQYATKTKTFRVK